AGQVATNAIAPYASQFIGSTLSDDQAAQLLSHAVLGAVMAYANNGNAATGAVAAAGAEAAADYLAKQLYPSAFDDNGRLQRDRLNENEVQQLLALTNAVGAVVGAVSSAASGGDSIAVLSGFNTGAQAAQNAVENNYLSDEQETDKQKALAKKQFALKKGAVYVKYEAIDKVQDIAFVAGYAAGVPGSVIEGLGDLFTAVLNPRETVAAMRELLKSDDVLGVLSDSVRQDFEDRLANIESEYQRGGTGAFNAGYEQSKLLTELSAVAIGGVGAVTSGIKVIARQIVSGRSDSGSSHSGNNVARGEADDFYQRNPDGSHYYPEKLGFVGQPKPGTIKEGTILDRYGDNDGSFLSPHGVPINQRALPPADEVRVYRQYEVLKPLPVLEGKIAPAYGSAGGGIQLLPNFTDIVNIDWLIRNGFLKEL
ncbi:MAG: glycohydrolase toxin TNT-related protein, partial [Moraxellaceae bacterium]|nr:glycohydrolase toxin TNT-related protein [Moraxellaceae bacterium]